jgi:glycosyltransferase involved in cell wall biosynthesis
MKPTIVMVAGHACVRVDKMARPLLEAGYPVHLISKKKAAHWTEYTTFTHCAYTDQYLAAMSLYDRVADVFHVHNEPSWFVTALKERTSKPVILDVHDSFLARVTPEESEQPRPNGKLPIRVSVEERNNYQLADGLVFPSAPFAQLVTEEFHLTQPAVVLPSYCPRRDVQYNLREWLGGLVYEGRVDLPEETHSAVTHGFRYSDYLALAQQAHALSMDFHLYARDDKPFLDLYEPLALTHVPQPYHDLLGCLARHDWGLVGNLTPTPEWTYALPNKLFEYVAAGVPVVALHAEACSDWLAKTGLGITVKSLDELASRWKEHRAIRAHLLTHRMSWTMEAHVGTLEALYARVCGG